MSEKLIEITAKDGVLIDLRYAGDNNVVGQAFYAREACYLHPAAKEKLDLAIKYAAVHQLSLKIWDGFRPVEAQKILWDASPTPEFVSHPEEGSCPHCRGVAVDLTLVDNAGEELDMGTDFDDFTDKAHHGYVDLPAHVQRNRYVLMGIMMTAGWDFYRNEWWHYQLFDARSYSKLNDQQAGTELIA